MLIAIAESCYNAGQLFGAELHFEVPGKPAWVYFGEAAGRIVLSVSGANCKKVNALAQEYGVQCLELGTVLSEDKFVVNKQIDIKISCLHDAWMQGLKL